MIYLFSGGKKQAWEAKAWNFYRGRNSCTVIFSVLWKVYSCFLFTKYDYHRVNLYKHFLVFRHGEGLKI